MEEWLFHMDCFSGDKFIYYQKIKMLRGGMMKRVIIVGFICVWVVLSIFSSAEDSGPLKIKGFYLGMEKSEVQTLYQKMKSDQTAQYISIENSEFRDLIQLDNEFGGMGNKIEIGYDESGKVNYLKFQYKTVDILFDANALEEKDFVNMFREKYGLPEMTFEDMGMVKIWKYTDEERKFSLSIDDYKNITLKVL